VKFVGAGAHCCFSLNLRLCTKIAKTLATIASNPATT
jgi:hypothetical protein